MNVFLGIMIPFIGTTIGAFVVYFIKNNFNDKLERVILGFASGVMIAASVWSLLIPAIERSEDLGYITWVPPAVGMALGFIILILIDNIVNKINNNNFISEKKRSSMLFLAVTLHNIPEGMAVGTIFAAFLNHTLGVTLASAFALSLGIAIQNIPEGTMISLPIKSDGYSKNYAFKMGVISGVVEPIFAFITILLTNIIVPLMPYLLSFAAGAMIYVVVHELIPSSQRKDNNLGPIGVAIGFIIMMVLDVALS